MKDEPDFAYFLIFSHPRSTKAFRCAFLIPAFVAILLLSCSPIAGIGPIGLQPVFPDEAGFTIIVNRDNVQIYKCDRHTSCRNRLESIGEIALDLMIYSPVP